jgi:signal transduction histidine kinase
VWALFAVVLLEIAIGATFQVLHGLETGEAWISVGDLGFFIAFVLFLIVGLILGTRRPDHPLGWILLAIGVVAFEPLSAYGDYALRHGLPAGDWAIAATSWTWVPTIGLAGTFVLLLFPDGHLPSPRWRWFAWAIAIGMVVSSFAILLSPGTLADNGFPDVRNPFGIEALRPLLVVGIAAIATVPFGVLGSAFSLVVRYRRSDPTERLQIRWLATSGAVVGIVYVIAMVVSVLSSTVGWAAEGGWVSVLQTVAILLFALLPIAIGVAVLKYRLYDIDVVIRKAVIVGAIVVFFTVVYAVVVGGIGALVQAHSTTPLSFVAAAVVAALFQPVLRRSRRIADRFVYGRRATPYEVLSEFSERVAGTYASEDVLPRMARIVGEGVGATAAQVWLEREGRLRVAASWPADGERPEPVAIVEASLPALPGADAAFPVEHDGELLGALAVTMPATDPMDEAKSKLVSDLAAQGGLVLRNVRLTDELRARLDELKAAQRRLVSAQDQERRKLERNIHDGAQQQLVALAVQLRLAQTLAKQDPARAEAMLGQLQAAANQALEDLRDLARGIYPPLLADKGLAAALEAQTRKVTVPVELRAAGIGRYPQEVEAAVYFSVLEGLQNVSKYADASAVVVTLTQTDGHLCFEVSDDGRGFDPASTRHGSGLQGITDRLAALDGRLEIRSAPGRGSTIVGRVPVPDHEMVDAT